MSLSPVPYYCEENVWHLCADDSVEGSPRAAIVLSNATRSIAMLHQRAAADPTAPIVWDYHVILATRVGSTWMIWDPDTTLGMPVPASTYLRASLLAPEGFAPPYDVRLRVIPAALYRRTLCTDRSHMLDEHGEYRVPPPPWPPIGAGTNLMRLVDMDDEIAGEVVTLAELPRALERLATAPGTPDD